MPEKFDTQLMMQTENRFNAIDTKLDKLVDSISRLTEVMARKEEADKSLADRLKKVEDGKDLLEGRVYVLELQNAASKPFRDIGMKAMFFVVGIIITAVAVSLGVK